MDTSEKSKAPLTEHREDAVMEGSTCKPDLVFMRSVGGQVWEHLDVHSEFVPKMASISSDLRYSPQPGIILAWAVGCGRGKSFQFREYMKRTLEDSPHMRVLLFSANVLYGTNLAHELEQCGFNVGFYKNKEIDEYQENNMTVKIVDVYLGTEGEASSLQYMISLAKLKEKKVEKLFAVIAVKPVTVKAEETPAGMGFLTCPKRCSCGKGTQETQAIAGKED